MRLQSMEIKDFRSIGSTTLDFDPRGTVLVGENSTGKTTIATALSRLFASVSSSLSARLNNEDYRYNDQDAPPTIKATIQLSTEELDTYLISPLIPPQLPPQDQQQLTHWLARHGEEIEISLTPELSNEVAYVQWGDLFVSANMVSRDRPILGGPGNDWQGTARAIAKNIDDEIEQVAQLKQVASILADSPASQMASNLGGYLTGQYKIVPEFRTRSMPGRTSGALESLAGEDLASTLLNLHVHQDIDQRERYERIKALFGTVFPRFKIEAIQILGSNTPDVLFYEYGRSAPLSLHSVSAGVHEILALITNLVARSGLLVFLEHPEEHLHPHLMRFLGKFLNAASPANQIVITTHSPYFVDPSRPESLRRFWLSKDGTRVKAPKLDGLSPRKLGQMMTALRRVDSREIVFARAVILVEEETTEAFLSEIAPRLELGVDAASVSIISVHGDKAFNPHHVLLDSLGIAHVNLRDPSWGVNPAYPSGRFFSLDAPSFESFIDENGLSDLRNEVICDVGVAKPRVAQEMGRRIRISKIPSIFLDVLNAAIALADRTQTDAVADAACSLGTGL